MKNRKSLENQENCTLIKHFIKELIRKIGPAFSGNPRKSRKSYDSSEILWKSMKITENQ